MQKNTSGISGDSEARRRLMQDQNPEEEQQLIPEADVDYMQLQCSAGYQGRLCATCLPGYHSSSSLECMKCPGNGSAAQLAIGVLLLLVNLVLVLHTVRSSFGARLAEEEEEAEEKEGEELKATQKEERLIERERRTPKEWCDTSARSDSKLSRSRSGLKQRSSRIVPEAEKRPAFAQQPAYQVQQVPNMHPRKHHDNNAASVMDVLKLVVVHIQVRPGCSKGQSK